MSMCIFRILFPDIDFTRLNAICIRRDEVLFRPFDINAGGLLQVDLAFKTLRKAGGHIVPKVLETWLKGWVTSHRMQRPHTYLLARLQRAQRHA